MDNEIIYLYLYIFMYNILNVILQLSVFHKLGIGII